MSDDSDSQEFERAMHGVEPVGEERRRAFRRRGRVVDSDEVVRFDVETEGSRVYGLRVGVEAVHLSDLRRGEPIAANSLDLHGMSEEAAREAVFRFVRQSRASGLKCISIVHGRGLRSPGGAVLRERVPRWLVQLPLAREVRAFASAPLERGGDGTLLVLLARGPR